MKNDGHSLSVHNRIDPGIFMCFMDLCLEHQNIPYERELYHDEGSDAEMTWNAVYRLREGEQRDG